MRISQQMRQPDEEESEDLPLLFGLARQWAWPAVLFRCQTHPHEATAVDKNGDTVLHWCAFGQPPVDVIEALLRVCPQKPNHKGQYPLHVACAYRARWPVIHALREAAPYVDHTGSAPLHILCDYGCSEEAMRSLLSVDGTITRHRPHGLYQSIPIELWNARKGMVNFQTSVMESLRIRRRRQREFYLQDEEWVRDEQQLHLYRDERFWRIASMLIYVSYTGQPLPEAPLADSQVLLACVGNEFCPIQLQSYAVLLYTDSLDALDVHGKTALHKAAASAQFSLINDILSLRSDIASIRDDEGKLPIDLLLAQNNVRWSPVLATLVEAQPPIVEDRLLPFLCAKLSPTALFRLFRLNPPTRCFGSM